MIHFLTFSVLEKEGHVTQFGEARFLGSEMFLVDAGWISCCLEVRVDF